MTSGSLVHPPPIGSRTSLRMLGVNGGRCKQEISRGVELDGNWREWRRYEALWDEFEEKGWEIGPVRYVPLPVVMAEFGPYHIAFRYRDSTSDECLFEVRQMHEGEEREVVLVWGVPTTREAEKLLDEHGVSPDELPGEPATGHGEFWSDLLPPVVHAGESGA